MGFTAEGYVKRSAEEIKNSLTTRLQNDYPSFRQWTADVQNNLLDTAVVPILEVENLLADFANSFAPGFANDFMWEQLAASLSLQYKENSQASVSLQFSGPVGAYIPPNTEVKGNFKTIQGVSINASGFAYITAYSDTTTVYAAGEIDTILTSTGVEGLTVTNPSASIPAQSVESNDALKTRGQAILRNPRVGTVDYALSRVLEVKGTAERTTSFVLNQNSSLGRIEPIIAGGETDEIATALVHSFIGLGDLVSEPSDNDTARTASWVMKYYGSDLEIKWTLPKLITVDVQVQMSFKNISAYKGKLEELIKNKFENSLNNLKVGSPINKIMLESLVVDSVKEMSIDPQYINTLAFKLSNQETSTDLTFDSYGYVAEIKKDIYVLLGNFTLMITT